MAPNLEERTEQLLLKREGFRQELEEFRTIVNNYEEGAPIYVIQRNLKELEVEFTSFKKNQCELDDRDEGQTQQDRVDLQQMFYVVTGHATTIINDATKQSEPTKRSLASNLSNLTLPESVDLPKIQLPTFSGAYEDWPGFADQFRCTVHDNPRIDDCKRLTYLRSCLTHDAALAISSLSNAAANCSVAWEILQERYNRPAKIVERHLQRIFNIGSFSRTVHRDLQSYTTKLELHYKALESLGQLTADTVLLYLCTSKLERETDLVWKDRVKSTPFPTFKEFLRFLNERCRVIESPRTTRQTAPRTHTFTTTQRTLVCPACEGSHAIWNCNVFKAKPIKNRIATAKRASLCTNCLTKGHSVAQCSAGSCRICGLRHHTYLHRGQSSETSQSPSSRSSNSHSSSDRSSGRLSPPNSPTPRSSRHSRRSESSPRSFRRSSPRTSRRSSPRTFRRTPPPSSRRPSPRTSPKRESHSIRTRETESSLAPNPKRQGKQ
jgi:hypothetical protein